MNTCVPGFQSFFRFFASFHSAKLATSSMRVYPYRYKQGIGRALEGTWKQLSILTDGGIAVLISRALFRGSRTGLVYV